MLRLHSEWAGIIRALPARAPTPAAAQLPQSPPTCTGTWTGLRHRVASAVASPASERSYHSASPGWTKQQEFRYTVTRSRSLFQNALLESLLGEAHSLWNANHQTHNKLHVLFPAQFTQERLKQEYSYSSTPLLGPYVLLMPVQVAIWLHIASVNIFWPQLF